MLQCRSRLLPISARSILTRRAHTSTPTWKTLQELQDGGLDTFRREAFHPSRPALLPRGHFLELPAIQTWFLQAQPDRDALALNYRYLEKFGEATVPLEFTRIPTNDTDNDSVGTFQRAELPFQFFLQWAKLATPQTPERLYLAQASFASLPQAMTNDLPTPEIVAKAGNGDIYDTNIWMGVAPTYTPLHRDPNPNLFVQLAGRKIVRMMPQDAGERVFAGVQDKLGKSGSATFRGEEIMKGEEKKLLEAAIWDEEAGCNGSHDEGFEAQVGAGDGLFIPKGWWHSIKGVGDGVLGSANWWFR